MLTRRALLAALATLLPQAGRRGALAVTCPAPIVKTSTTGQPIAVTFTATTSGGKPPIRVTYTPASGSLFPIGTTWVTVIARSRDGQSDACTFPVTILKDEPPIPEETPVPDFGGYRPQFLGPGTTTAGGRGGTLWRVNSLADTSSFVINGDGSRSGTLRAALTASGARTVVFETSGYIDIASEISITQPFLTVAGQTAPNPGITIRAVPSAAPWAYLALYTHDVVFQHLRVRPGDTACNSGFQLVGGAQNFNIVFDHCSTSWGQDENMALGTPTNLTVWRCITSEALYRGGPGGTPGVNGGSSCTGGGVSDGSGMGFGSGTTSTAILESIFAKNTSRNPQVGGNANVVLINNLIYNWVAHGFMFTNDAAGGSSNPWHHTAIGNRFIVGLNSDSPGFGATLLTFINNVTFPERAGNEIYQTDNTFTDTVDPGIIVTSGIGALTGEFNALTYDPHVGSPPSQAPIPTGMVPIASTAVEAFVTTNAGARPLNRDAVDTRLLNEITSRTGTIISTVAAGGGYPALAVVSQAFTDPSNPNAVAPGHESTGRTNREVLALEPAALAIEEAGSGGTGGGDVTVVQSVGTDGTTGVYNATLTSVTTGNSVVVSVIQLGVASTTWTASDGVNGAYDINYQGAGVSGGDDLWIFSKRSVTGGFTQVTITPVNTSVLYAVRVYELSNVSASVAVQTNDTGTQPAGTSFVCGSTGLTGRGFFLGIGQFTDNVDVTPGAGYTADGDTSVVAHIFQRQTGSLTSNQAPFTTSASVIALGAMALFTGSATTAKYEPPSRFYRPRKTRKRVQV